ncbi:DJ-1 family glyoxalase III [Tichowtungia aerotolerans]|uniref:DJ-1 family protein n=1 Tax=Tichowtungia aerotolerans TaxID=2697043 RepID=A0A6P1LZJ4_9BACT|nr:DJ-1 family glyoxalase III [Tichowtungia aerotolerans]QHI67959.1 DJ-1 family protein [Tichowtungia aerotolerans]
MTRVIVPVANGSEEIETVTIIDVLRRAGWEVVLAGIQGSGPVTASRGVKLIPDAQWEKVDLSTFDMIVLPGGMDGTNAFCENDGVQEALRIFDIEELWIGAICAAPLALHKAGVLKHRAFTCYPGIEQKMKRRDRSGEAVVVSGHVITSQGPGTAMPFALRLIELVDGKDAAGQVATGLLY